MAGDTATQAEAAHKLRTKRKQQQQRPPAQKTSTQLAVFHGRGGLVPRSPEYRRIEGIVREMAGADRMDAQINGIQEEQARQAQRLHELASQKKEQKRQWTSLVVLLWASVALVALVFVVTLDAYQQTRQNFIEVCHDLRTSEAKVRATVCSQNPEFLSLERNLCRVAFNVADKSDAEIQKAASAFARREIPRLLLGLGGDSLEKWKTTGRVSDEKSRQRDFDQMLRYGICLATFSMVAIIVKKGFEVLVLRFGHTKPAKD